MDFSQHLPTPTSPPLGGAAVQVHDSPAPSQQQACQAATDPARLLLPMLVLAIRSAGVKPA